MDIWEYHKNHFRLKKVKKYWETNQKYLAIQSFLFSVPCFLFPFSDDQGLRGAYGYDYCWRKCRNDFGIRGMNTIKCWRIYLWRQFLHTLGGFFVSIPLVLPLFFFFQFYLIMFFVPIGVAIFAILKEITWDYRYENKEIEKEYGEGAYEFKHLTDVIFWFFGSSILPLAITLMGKVNF